MSKDIVPIALLAAVGTVVVVGSVYVYQQSRQPSAVTIENLQHSARMTEQRREKMQEGPAATETSATAAVKKEEPAKAPETAKAPEPTKAPEPPKAPEPKAPEPPKAAEPAKAPEPPNAAEPTKAPEPPKAAEPATPAASAAQTSATR